VKSEAGTVRLRRLGEGPGRAGIVDLARYFGLIAILLTIEPMFAGQYQIRLANLVLVQGIAALAANVILGFAGLVSIALAATMALGGYTSALLMMKLGWSFPLAFLGACVLSATVSGLVGLLGTRIKTNYFLLVTLALSQVVTLVIVNEAWLTGGPTGLLGVPPAAILGFVADTDRRFYVLVVPIFVVALYVAQRLRQSKAGRAMFALRLNEPAARMSGIDVNRYRVAAMMFAGAYLGASGSLFAHLLRFLGPESFTLSLSLLLTLIVVIGGIGSNFGAAISVAVVTVITQSLQDTSGSTWVLYYGIVIMALLVFAPRGLLGLAANVSAMARGMQARMGRHVDTT
jgi:branched-chain amino acid transport system permease protein